MVHVQGLFESHLTVTNLQLSIDFYGSTLGLEVAGLFSERGAAFFWVGEPGNSMLGLWQVGNGPQRMNLHIALRTSLPDILKAPTLLRAVGVEPLDFEQQPTDEPVVLAWLPAASLYFRDPDGHSLEFLAMLPDAPQPERGVVSWTEWTERKRSPI